MHRIFVIAVLGFVAAGCAATHEQTLDNGLRVLVKEDHRSPVVISQVWYKVGSVDEPEKSTGISHALEHMMFKGTTRIAPGDFSRRIAEEGGRENAFTSYDYTGYYQQLERSRLPVSFELEADRMQNLLLTPEEFAKEIQVVMEERRLRTEDQPEALLEEKFMATAFTTSPYKNPVIGWMRDLEHMTSADLGRWYQLYYAPNNATLVVVGDVVPREVFDLAKKYFNSVPRREIGSAPLPAEPGQNGERRTRVSASAEVAALILGYHVPVFSRENVSEAYALMVAAGVLDGGNAARLARELVREQQVAAAVDVSYNPIARAPGLFTFEATPAGGHSVEQLEAALRRQVARLRDEPVAEDELRRVKAQVVASDVYARDSVSFQAMQLGQFASVGLDSGELDRSVARVQAVTAEQIQAVARKYFVDVNLTVGVLDPLPIGSGKRPIPTGGSHVR